jgi:hypothetical protein
MNVAIVSDWGQTRYIASHPQVYWEEDNPFLGKHPSMGQVNAWFIGSLAVNNGIMVVLPKKYRPYYAGAVTAYEAHLVIRNNSIGVKVDF